MSAMTVSRRSFMHVASGLGAAAIAELLARDVVRGSERPASEALGDLRGGLHHPAKARRVIQLFMNGGASQMDLFDHKPLLIRDHGKPFDPGGGQRVEAATSTPGTILAPPYPLRQH
ncbi:MAG: DUF1501 domain-containing protein, partial [Planctomycetia bacterium]